MRLKLKGSLVLQMRLLILLLLLLLLLQLLQLLKRQLKAI